MPDVEIMLKSTHKLPKVKHCWAFCSSSQSLLWTTSCLILASEVPADIHTVRFNVVIVQVPIPLPMSVGAVFECQDTMPICRLTESWPLWLTAGAQCIIKDISGANAPRLIGGHCLVCCGALTGLGSKCLVCSGTGNLAYNKTLQAYGADANC